MSYKKKQATQQPISSQSSEQMEHQWLNIDKRGNIVNLKVKAELDEDWKLTLTNFLEDNVHYDKKKNLYQVKQKDLESFLADIESLHLRYTTMKEKRKSKKHNSEQESRSHSRSS